MRRYQKDRLIGAMRLEYNNGGLMVVRRRGEQVILSGIWPGGIMTKREATALMQLLKQACGRVPASAPTLAGHWTLPHEQREVVR